MRGVSRGRVLMLMLMLMPTAAIVVACVDGVTPDCSDPKVKCGPDLDPDARAVDGAETATETGSGDTGLPDVADSEPDPDAGDEI